MVYEDDEEDLIDLFGPLKLEQKEIIFMPLNDNTDKFKVMGGSHWALLVYFRNANEFHYFDSAGEGLIGNVEVIMKKMAVLLKRDDIGFKHIENCFK